MQLCLLIAFLAFAAPAGAADAPSPFASTVDHCFVACPAGSRCALQPKSLGIWCAPKALYR